MKHWTVRRRASLAIHIGIVAVPFIFATVSAAAFWYGLFQDGWIAAALVLAFDASALIGLVLYIARIASPFQALRHLLPFVSVVPLGIELYQRLSAHNDMLLSAAVSVIVTTAMTLIAWRCWVTIEGLFVSRAVAAREQVEERLTAAREVQQEQLRMLTATMTTTIDMQASVRMVVQDWLERGDIRVSAPAPALTGDVMPAVSTQAVKAYAEISGVSERTVWRQLKSGKLSASDIGGEE